MKDATDLINRCLKNERKAQKELYDMFAPKMFAICIRISHTREDAEDSMQNGFLKLFKHLHTYTGSGSFEGWVKKIIVNNAIENVRTKRVIFSEMPIHVRDHSENGYDKLCLIDLEKEINLLSTGYRNCFKLYAEGYNHKEIANILGIEESTSKSQYCRAKKTLVKKLNHV